MSSEKPIPTALPELKRLHERHRGLTESQAGTYSEAASVCLSVYHESPRSFTVLVEGEHESQHEVSWDPPGVQLRACYGNREDAVCQGAYGLTLAAVEVRLGLVAIGRTGTRTGSDYYIGPPGGEVSPVDGRLDLEGAIRLEVGGMSEPRYDREWYALLNRKVKQLRAASTEEPGMAGVAAFSCCRVALKRAV